MDAVQTVRSRLLALSEPELRRFSAKLVPDLDPERVLGVRVPALRALARELAGTQTAQAFLDALPHRHLEENHLHGFLIERIRDYDECMAALERFLPYVDNWATCDGMNPPVFRKHRPELAGRIPDWLAGGRTYTVRFALRMMMSHFLREDFAPSYLETAASVRSGEYYVHMMTAWFFATALAFQWEQTLPYLTRRRLDRWVHNRTIQKAVESRRITQRQKAELRALRWR